MARQMIRLTLPFPPSVNTYYRRGKLATYLSKKGRDYKKEVAELISTHTPAIENALEGRLSAFLGLSAPTRRSFDIDNRIKAVFDSLQDAGVFDDDEQIDSIVVKRLPVGGNYCNVIICEEGV